MPIYVMTNSSSLMAQRNASTASQTLSLGMRRASSGLRINSAQDDAAGLSVSLKMTMSIRSLDQTVRNANDGISLAQTAEAAIQEIQSNLQRLRELAVQSSNSTLSSQDRSDLSQEATSLLREVDRVASSTSFNGVNLLDGSYQEQSFQIGTESGGVVDFSMINMMSAALGGSALGVTQYTTSIVSRSASSAAFTAGDLSINGYKIAAPSSDGTSYSVSRSSAIARAAAINAVSSQTGVIATVNSLNVDPGTNTVTSYGTTLADSELMINGVSLGAFIACTSSEQRANDVVAAINAVSGETGVTAVASRISDGIKVYLTARDGRNITIQASSVATGHVVGFHTAGASTKSTCNISTITLTSISSLGITIGGTGTTGFGLSGDLGLTAASISAGAGISVIDLTTQTGAQAALAVLDKALQQTGGARTSLGALQSRFESAISVQKGLSENLTQARGRIRDADFATESASITKGKVLQKASMAMLSQANMVSSEIALNLLKR